MSSDFGKGVGKCFGYEHRDEIGSDYQFGAQVVFHAPASAAGLVGMPAPDAAAPAPVVTHGWIWHLFHPFHKAGT